MNKHPTAMDRILFLVGFRIEGIHFSNHMLGLFPMKYSLFRFKFSALKLDFPAYCAIHSAENALIGRKKIKRNAE